jgi:hypothetical protein
VRSNPRTYARQPGTLFEAAVDEESGHSWSVLIFDRRETFAASDVVKYQVSCVDVLQQSVATVVS